MVELSELSAPHCLLLAVHYAAEANITALQELTSRRHDAFEPALIFRILLTYLPESIDPSQYTGYIHDIAAGSRTHDDEPAVALDVSLVKTLSGSQARRRVHKLHLQPLAHSLYQAESSLDPLTLFLLHRAHQIDAETGLLDLVPHLVSPFLESSVYLRTWFISTVLPLLRLAYEYYPQNPTPSLEAFAQMKGRKAVESQLLYLRRSGGTVPDTRDPARDIRGVVGPWMCGARERNCRELHVHHLRGTIDEPQSLELDDWGFLFDWLVSTAKEDFALASSAIMGWDGPKDLSLEGYGDGHMYIDDERQRQLELRYAQSALACLYLVENSSVETIQTAHSVLVRLATLLNMETPRDLNMDVGSLPVCDLNPLIPDEYASTALQDEHMLEPNNILTQPDRKSIRLLELFISSACVLSSMEYHVSVRDLAKFYLRNDNGEQISLIKKILHSLSSGPKKDAHEWEVFRSRLLWLWNWGASSQENRQGIFARIESQVIEIEILKALLESGHYGLATQIYIQNSFEHRPLPLSEAEKAILETSMHHYDNASNGNRTRGGMKRASDIIATFISYFPDSTRFQRAQALLSATHAMSFYSLILQHGVPFQPVNIRVSANPLSLLSKVLIQNHGSYTHLDDLISIGQNLIVAMPSTLMDEEPRSSLLDPAEMGGKKAAAKRRVIGMAIEAALAQDDFETAYSYVVNHLSPPLVSPDVSMVASTFSFDSNESTGQDVVEDVWRAALLAGRHQSSPMSSSTAWTGSTTHPDLRRLEQRMELLSQALLLAPLSHLEEVLIVWQQCEAEMARLLADEVEAEERFNDLADRRLPGAFANETIAVQPRREVGRGAVEEAPMGLFDVARGAAAAFSKSAFPLRGINPGASIIEASDARASPSRSSLELASDSESIGGADERSNRARKRDMVASAVTGGLASGIGWVLGAKPVQDQQRE
ncbi:secretory pathway Sec39 [Lindgomyces ingoldianus]|uniref:Secretory pathway Sec39 n=1 Tax=Lindgomyces ingoldianus TaxID=673940 RepID=A0ACB6RFD7_9PLEO|nr:secretory pathway Sec39 [Lindgomyces ingoldianus]KAF2477035.1 secretory pathway Sec39 [Lindgomyces ingoldianus]